MRFPSLIGTITLRSIMATDFRYASVAFRAAICSGVAAPRPWVVAFGTSRAAAPVANSRAAPALTPRILLAFIGEGLPGYRIRFVNSGVGAPEKPRPSGRLAS